MKEHILAVLRMQDYIAIHVMQEINLADLAKTSFFSHWYAHRLFQERIGLSPAEYIRKLQLTEAEKS